MATSVCVMMALVLTTMALREVSGTQKDQPNIVPVEVDVYYEAVCPDSKRFFMKQLPSTFNKLSNDIILKFIPYGNAKVQGGGPHMWKFTCQHGPEECYGNTVQACAIELLNNTMNSLNFIICAFTCNTQEKSISQCLNVEELQKSVKKCALGKMGNDLLYSMGQLTDALNPPQTFIPWITINGHGSQDINDKANKNLFNLICSSYEGTKPSACRNSKKRNVLNNSYHKDSYL